MNTFDYVIKALWDIGFFTIFLPFLLVLVISVYFFKWLFEDKMKKSKKVFVVIRWALSIAVSLAVLWLTLQTTAFGYAFGLIIGIFFIFVFVFFIIILLGHYMDFNVLGKEK
ncbi:MAG: hypothetical protein JW716_02000 [Candidatus Aenigmarchaeota archaeon]|nr:hypothetical protein [Candidatus Aenigmarchaeota archaeon]